MHRGGLVPMAWSKILLACVVLCVAGCGRAKVETAVPAPEAPSVVKSIAIVTLGGDVNPELLARAVNFVVDNCRVPVKSRKVDPPAAVDAAAALAALKAADEDLLIALVTAPVVPLEACVAVYPEVGVATVNLTPLIPAAKMGTMPGEGMCRRVDRETMRALGTLLALSECPNPTCALSKHESIKFLDMKGRNFCPPCQGRAEHALRERGFVPQHPAVIYAESE